MRKSTHHLTCTQAENHHQQRICTALGKALYYIKSSFTFLCLINGGKFQSAVSFTSLNYLLYNITLLKPLILNQNTRANKVKQTTLHTHTALQVGGSSVHMSPWDLDRTWATLQALPLHIIPEKGRVGRHLWLGLCWDHKQWGLCYLPGELNLLFKDPRFIKWERIHFYTLKTVVRGWRTAFVSILRKKQKRCK